MPSIKLGNTIIDTDRSDVYTIAEIGQNHQGSIDTARKMILEAKNAGCNCVKFQKSDLTAKFTQSALCRKYENPNSWGSTYGEHKQYLEFSKDQYYELMHFCKENCIDFTASAMDEVSLEFLNQLDVPFIKIGSGDANNFPLLKKAANFSTPLIISTGMQSIETIDTIVSIMKTAGKENFALLHCVSAYPTSPSDCGLQFIPVLKERYPEVVIGYSGHEIGIEISKAAVLIGARIVERHFTLDKNQKGSDHRCSLEPMELKMMIQGISKLRDDGFLNKSDYTTSDIKNILQNTCELDLALSEVQRKTILPCEKPCKGKLGKSLVATKTLNVGTLLTELNISVKVSEPNGMPAELYYTAIGRKLSKEVQKDEPILENYLLI